MRATAALIAVLALSACQGSTTGDGLLPPPGAEAPSADPAPAATPAPAPSPSTPPAPTPPAPAFRVSGWLPTWTGATGRQAIIINSGGALDEANPFWYGLRPDGSLKVASQARDQAFIAAVKDAGGELIPTIHDVEDGSATDAVMASATLRQVFVQALLSEVDTYGYDGIDVDLEHIKSSSRDAFHLFMQDLSAGLKARGKILTAAIPGKRAGSGSWAGYDYAAVGALVDRFKIMTYGYSGPWTRNPGPIAPIHWIEDVLDFAVTQMDPAKIYIGLPFYGYDWPADGSRIRSVTWPSVQSRIAQSNSGPAFDAVLGETRLEYTDANGVAHTVFYQDERGIAAKASLAERYGVGGISIWAVGYGDPAFWTALDAAKNPARP